MRKTLVRLFGGLVISAGILLATATAANAETWVRTGVSYGANGVANFTYTSNLGGSVTMMYGVGRVFYGSEAQLVRAAYHNAQV